MCHSRLFLLVAVFVSLDARGVVHAAAPGVLERIRGVVRAEARATLSSELLARITELPFQTGEAFARGDVLVRFDCRRYEADLKAARAEAKGHRVTVRQNRQLLRHRAGGSSDVLIAEAKLEQAEAAVEALQVRMSQCVIAAPFDGRVAERMVEVHEIPEANKPLVKIVKAGKLEVDVIVPSNWLARLTVGHRFTFKVDETGDTLDAVIRRLGATVDPISRTVRLTGELIAPSVVIRPGMSGSADLFPAEG